MNSTTERAGNSQNPPLVCIAGLSGGGGAGREANTPLLFTFPDVEVTDGVPEGARFHPTGCCSSWKRAFFPLLGNRVWPKELLLGMLSSSSQER